MSPSHYLLLLLLGILALALPSLANSAEPPRHEPFPRGPRHGFRHPPAFAPIPPHKPYPEHKPYPKGGEAPEHPPHDHHGHGHGYAHPPAHAEGPHGPHHHAHPPSQEPHPHHHFPGHHLPPRKAPSPGY
ncbi:hypothetical protein MLD38_027270 [Melastoma candidum]|uniref:Uncharacterized protein n=1 Tax=Melastoma candidum TaxID=119954 RepID=A0ACB9P413_9MYRT|nr:hypothetical protein MLD38_027270 [Melastoma candidum]